MGHSTQLQAIPHSSIQLRPFRTAAGRSAALIDSRHCESNCRAACHSSELQAIPYSSKQLRPFRTAVGLSTALQAKPQPAPQAKPQNCKPFIRAASCSSELRAISRDCRPFRRIARCFWLSATLPPTRPGRGGLPCPNAVHTENVTGKINHFPISPTTVTASIPKDKGA